SSPALTPSTRSGSSRSSPSSDWEARPPGFPSRRPHLAPRCITIPGELLPPRNPRRSRLGGGVLSADEALIGAYAWARGRWLLACEVVVAVPCSAARRTARLPPHAVGRALEVHVAPAGQAYGIAVVADELAADQAVAESRGVGGHDSLDQTGDQWGHAD